MISGINDQIASNRRRFGLGIAAFVAVTALVGGPFFLWLLHRTRREHGGWA